MKFLFLLIVLFLQPTSIFAIQAVVMKNIFYAPAKDQSFKPYLEIYWQINPQTIVFDKTNDAYQARIRTDIIISNDTGAVREEHYILATTPVTDGQSAYSQSIIDLRRYELQDGQYTMQIKFTDELKPSNQYSFEDSFAVENFKTIALSDIQFVDTSVVSNKQNIFQRNGNLQIPLCSNFMDEHRKSLHYYAELYQKKVDSGFLICKTYISKKDQDYTPVNKLLRTDTLSMKPVHIIENKFSLSTLPSGNYNLNIIIENPEREKLLSKSIFFQLMNPRPEVFEEIKKDDTSSDSEFSSATYLNLNKTFLGKYNPSQIRAILKMIIPVADPNERANINGFLKRPDDTYARYFVYNFWLRRNQLKPEDAWKEYAEKVKEVNRLFGSSLLTGYESERGMIYLKYGEPTERIVVNNEANALPYEVWQYDALPNASNAFFLFYKPGLVVNDYRLLHSTVNGETRNKNWRTSLYINGISEDISNSRAEQYIGSR